MENGLAIITVRIRLGRLSSLAKEATLIERSCKHLCCREGVEKKPKPPKSSTAAFDRPAKALKDPKQKTLQACTPTVSNKISKTSISRPNLSNIDTVNLSGRHGNEQSKKGVRGSITSQQKTNRSGSNLSPTNISTQKSPKSSYAKGDYPHISFLERPQNTEDKSAKDAMSDYDDSWLYDLPSPSELLDGTRIAKQIVGGLAAESSKEKTVYDEYPGFENDVEDLFDWDEAAAYSQTSILRNEPVSKGSLPRENEIEPTRSLSPDIPPRSPIAMGNLFGVSNETRSDEKLFFSTSSPEKVTETHDNSHKGLKRKTSAPSDYSTLPIQHPTSTSTKKSRVESYPAGRPLGASFDAENRASSSAALGESKVALGMEGIDPDLLAEFKDIVEFI